MPRTGWYLRREIQRSLSLIESRDIDWFQLIASGEQLGREFEQQIDESKKQFEDDLSDSDGGGGNG